MRFLPIVLIACSAPSPAHEAEPVDSGTIAITLRGPDVLPGDEGLKCIDVPAPAGPVAGWTIKRSGVHHVNAWVRTTGTPFADWSPCGDAKSKAEFIFDASSDLTERLPDGMVYELPPSLMFDVHYINTGAEPVPQWVTVEFLKGDPDAIPVGGLSLGQAPAPLNLAPGTTKTVTFSVAPLSTIQLVSLMGHMHAHGTEQTVSVNGAEVYRTTSWADPAIAHPSGVSVGPGAPLTWACAFTNDTATAIQWGATVDHAEMCQVFGLSTKHWTATGKVVP